MAVPRLVVHALSFHAIAVTVCVPLPAPAVKVPCHVLLPCDASGVFPVAVVFTQLALPLVFTVTVNTVPLRADVGLKLTEVTFAANAG